MENMIGSALKGLFFIYIIFWYSTGIWKMINDYFGKEFKMYIAEELTNNKRLQIPLEKLKEQESDVNILPLNEKIINSWNKMDVITQPSNAVENDKSNEISIKDESNEVPLNEMSCSECCRVNGIRSTCEQNPSDDNFVCDDDSVNEIETRRNVMTKAEEETEWIV